MKILLAAINAKYIHSNLAVYSLRAYAKDYLKRKNLDETMQIGIAEYTINQQMDEMQKDIYTNQPDVLCFSCYIWNIGLTEALVREVKKLCPDIQIWLGGPEVSYDAVEVLERLPELAGIMKGEGERTFAELCESYIKHGRPSGIKGTVYREPAGHVRDCGWREVMDLNDVPFVYQDIAAFRHKIIYYETSRGCPFVCSYCLSSVDKALRFRDTELVKKELQQFMDWKVPQVKLVDRTFNCSHSHAVEIWKYLLEHDNGVTNFHFEVAADLLNEEELILMEMMRPGLIKLEIGVQSTNPDTISEIRRTMKFERVKRITKRIRRAGNIHQHLDLIAGLPYEGIESFSRSFDDVYALEPDQLQLGFLKVLKGSYMEAQKETYGLVCKSVPPYEVLYTKWLSYKDILELKGVEEMVEIYYNSGQFSHTRKQLEGEFASPYHMYDELRKFYERRGILDAQHKRSTKYELLLAFAEEIRPVKRELYQELLTFDYYLRENARNRPEFAGEYQLSMKTLKDFYDQEAKNRKYLKGYEGYDGNQMRKMTHLERFPKLGKTVLFDYIQRNPLNKDARTCMIEEIL